MAEEQAKDLNSKKGRIIIRNLVFDIQEKHLRQLLTKFGEIQDIQLPINPSNNRSKGFAFVEFKNKNSAMQAIKQLNESNYKGRTILLDFSVDTRQYQQFKDTLKKESEVEQIEEEKEYDEAEEEDVEEEELKQPKQSKQQKQPKQQEEKKKRYDDSDMSDTIFVRNIPYTIDEQEFKEFFQKFGDFQYAKLVINKQTQETNGTGFIKFKEAKVAQDLIKKSQSTANQARQKNVINDLEIQGRLMIVLPALQRENIPEKQEKIDKSKINIKKTTKLEDLVLFDSNKKRNLYLAQEGLFKAQKGMSDMDFDKFSQHYKEKVQKLKNPNMYVSKTRVMIKNMQKSVDDDDIEQIVKNYTNTLEKKQQKHYKQIALLREKEKVDQKTQEQKSKGLCFIEFLQHDTALGFINHIVKNYSKIFKKMPIIEFAIEDARYQKKRLDIQEARENPKEKVQDQEKDQDRQTSKANYSLLKQMIKDKKFKKGEMEQLLKGIRLRGLRQRVKKQIEKEAGENFFEQSQLKSKQQVKKNEKEKIQKKKIEKQLDQQEPKIQNNQKEIIKEKKERQEIKKIKQQIKKKKQIKEDKLEEDEFDVFAKDYTRKLQKKLKWDQNQDNAVIL